MGKVILDQDYLFFECPSCFTGIQVHISQINCRIFRHAAYKNTLTPIHPHAPKEVCEMLVQTGQVYGCAKPFMLGLDSNGDFVVSECEYV